MNRGKTFANFSLLGNIPIVSDWLIIKVKGFVNTGARLFNNLTEIPSIPVEVLVRKDNEVLFTSSWVTKVKLKDVMICRVSHFPGTVALWIIHCISVLPLGKGWIQSDGIVLDIWAMGPIFLVWIGQTLWVMECTVRDWDAAIFYIRADGRCPECICNRPRPWNRPCVSDWGCGAVILLSRGEFGREKNKICYQRGCVWTFCYMPNS